MIKEIYIKNFRCFKSFETQGFQRINLIGGMNNVGKTCLLEAVFAFLRPDDFNNSIGIRDSQETKEDQLASLYYQRNTQQELRISDKNAISNDVIFTQGD